MTSWKIIPFYAVMVLFVFFAIQVSAQTLLQITSPSNSSSAIPVYREGQTYTVTLSADPSVSNISVISDWHLPDAQPTGNPLQFTLTLPTNITPGIYNIGAIGFTSSGDVEAVPSQIDVERQDAPLTLTVSPSIMTFSVGDTRSASKSSHSFTQNANEWGTRHRAGLVTE